MTSQSRLFSPRVVSIAANARPPGSPSEDLLEQLGLPADRTALVAEIRRGFPVALVERLVGALQLPQHALLRIARIAPATLARRRRTPDARLSPDESDRLYQIASTFRDAVALFEGETEAAAGWLKEPAKALGGVAPIELLDTAAGAAEVRDLIGRLEHGVYS
jgi:putative toxin-antitoxin system antitoxin component (TIGR02293 family)